MDSQSTCRRSASLAMQHRVAERLYPASQEVSWSRPGQPTLRAAVQDRSRSGIGLVVPGSPEIGLGSLIRVMFHRHPAPRYARVVRLEHADSQADPILRLGCRWVTGAKRAARRHAGHGRHRQAMCNHYPLKRRRNGNEHA
jgi:PilZ domain